MAHRLALGLETERGGPDAGTWLRMQMAYDLWQAEQRPAPKVRPAIAKPSA